MPLWIGLGLGAVTGGAGIISSLIGASAQTNAAQNAIAAQQASLQQGYNYANTQETNAQNVLNPYTTIGQTALTGYANALPSLTAPFTGASLATTPGYQFTLQQGLKSTQNGYAAEGLGTSGAAAKGAAQYATGLAQNTYNQQFSNYLAQNQQIANMYLSGGQIGESAAAAMGGIYGQLGAAGLGGAVQTGQGVAGSITGAGNAIAGAATGAANSIGSGVNSALQYSLLTNELQAQQANASLYAGLATNGAYAANALSTTGAGLGAGSLGAAQSYMLYQ